jgi:2-haloacid dehalogenase
VDLDRFSVLTFDCFGTLIDWEAGIAAGLRPILRAHRVRVSRAVLLEAYAAAEAAAEAGPYRPYRDILRETVIRIGSALGFSPTVDEADAFAVSIERWPPFPDSVDALARLRRRYALGAVTNCDDDLFSSTSRALGDPFRWIVTAQQARAYKPAEWVFRLALDRVGVPASRVLHVAQSTYHDHLTARRLGLATVRVNRRQRRRGSGATLPVDDAPRADLEVPDLLTLAELAGV